MSDPTKLRPFSKNLGVRCAGVMRGGDGSPMLHQNGVPVQGTITLNPELMESRESEYVAPTYYLELFVKLDGKPEYKVRMDVDDFNSATRFMKAMAAKLPAGIQFTEDLHDGILYGSLEPESFRTYDTSFYKGADGGLYLDGKQLSREDIAIVDEVRTQDNSPAYVLRNAEGSQYVADGSGVSVSERFVSGRPLPEVTGTDGGAAGGEGYGAVPGVPGLPAADQRAGIRGQRGCALRTKKERTRSGKSPTKGRCTRYEARGGSVTQTKNQPLRVHAKINAHQ